MSLKRLTNNLQSESTNFWALNIDLDTDNAVTSGPLKLCQSVSGTNHPLTMRVIDVDGPLREAPPPRHQARSTAGLQSTSSRNYVTVTVPAMHGYAFPVSAGSRFRVVDLHGEQVVDFMAWTRSSTTSPITGQTSHTANLNEKVSMAYTRYHLSGAPPQVGEGLWTNSDKQLLTVTADTCRVHDMTFMSCCPEFYERYGRFGHRSCATNISEVMAAWGMKSHLEIADPFNIFQNTPNYTIKGNMNPSRKGDYIEFEASEDCVCAVSSCPFDIDGFNGGTVTDVAVLLESKDRDLALQIEAEQCRSIRQVN